MHDSIYLFIINSFEKVFYISYSFFLSMNIDNFEVTNHVQESTNSIQIFVYFLISISKFNYNQKRNLIVHLGKYSTKW